MTDENLFGEFTPTPPPLEPTRRNRRKVRSRASDDGNGPTHDSRTGQAILKQVRKVRGNGAKAKINAGFKAADAAMKEAFIAPKKRGRKPKDARIVRVTDDIGVGGRAAAPAPAPRATKLDIELVSQLIRAIQSQPENTRAHVVALLTKVFR